MEHSWRILSRWALQTQAQSFCWGPRRRQQSNFLQHLSLDMADHCLHGALVLLASKALFSPWFPPTSWVSPFLFPLLDASSSFPCKSGDSQRLTPQTSPHLSLQSYPQRSCKGNQFSSSEWRVTYFSAQGPLPGLSWSSRPTQGSCQLSIPTTLLCTYPIPAQNPPVLYNNCVCLLNGISGML